MTCDGADTKKYVSRRGTMSKQQVAKKGKWFTTLLLIALKDREDGKLLMCVVIIEGTQRNMSVESGIQLYSQYQYIILYRKLRKRQSISRRTNL